MRRYPLADSLAFRAAGALSAPISGVPDVPRRSTAVMRVDQVLDLFAARDVHGEILTAVRHYPAREAQWAEFPSWTNADLRKAYEGKGIRQLYSHQAAGAEAVHAGKSI